MSLKRNVLASYASQIYVTLVGIVMVPLYVRYMGAEAYGLVGFFAMLQAWFNLLDLGLTPTMARETARFRGGALDARDYRRLVRTLQSLFLIAAFVGGAAMFAAAGFLARDWLRASRLPTTEVLNSIRLMAVIIAMRWMAGLYRSTISGSERLVWLGSYQAVFATLRFVAVLPVLMFVGVTPTLFFGFQLAVAVLELAGLVWYANGLLPPVEENGPAWDWTALRPLLGFSLKIAFTSTLWVLVTQTDKLLLSRLLPLAEYGFYTLAVLVAGGVMIVSAPISGAILPHMARMNAEADEAGLIRLYREATQLVAVVAIPTSLVLAVFGGQILWTWTGNRDISRDATPVLVLYALGNGLCALGTVCYYLQFAKGDLTLHVVEAPLYLAVFLPGLLWLTARYGSVGAGWAWLGTYALFFLFWVPLVHRRFDRGLHLLWLRDIGGILVLALSAVLFEYIVVDRVTGWPRTGALNALVLALFGLLTVGMAALGSRRVRRTLQRQWTRARG